MNCIQQKQQIFDEVKCLHYFMNRGPNVSMDVLDRTKCPKRVPGSMSDTEILYIK